MLNRPPCAMPFNIGSANLLEMLSRCKRRRLHKQNSMLKFCPDGNPYPRACRKGGSNEHAASDLGAPHKQMHTPHVPGVQMP